MPSSNTTFTFTNLPTETLTDYDSWVVVAVPVNSGLGDATTRWDAAEDEAVSAITSSTRPGGLVQRH